MEADKLIALLLLIFGSSSIAIYLFGRLESNETIDRFKTAFYVSLLYYLTMFGGYFILSIRSDELGFFLVERFELLFFSISFIVFLYVLYQFILLRRHFSFYARLSRLKLESASYQRYFMVFMICLFVNASILIRGIVSVLSFTW